MRHGLFHPQLHPSHEGFERAMLALNVLILVVVLTWCAWQLLTASPLWPELFKPEPMQFWWD